MKPPIRNEEARKEKLFDSSRGLVGKVDMSTGSHGEAMAAVA